jgi:hypothetical protein
MRRQVNTGFVSKLRTRERNGLTLSLGKLFKLFVVERCFYVLLPNKQDGEEQLPTKEKIKDRLFKIRKYFV